MKLDMKKIILLVLLFFTIQVGFSQKSLKFGLNLESSYVSPLKLSEGSEDFRGGLSYGGGVYAVHDIWKCFSADIGLIFRQKSFQQVMNGYFYDPYPNFQYEPRSWVRFYQSQLTVPLHLRIYLTKRFFLVSGIEHAFILNHKGVKNKSEDNWTIGFGGHPGKLNWTLTYVEGFQERGVIRVIENKHYTSGYKNRTIQLSFYYPLWQKK
jgi:hypothetical protein